MPGCLISRRAPARPRQAVVVAADLRLVGLGAQRHQVELVLVAHMRLQPLRRLAGIAGREAAAVDLAQQILRRRPLVFHLDVLEHLVGEAELLRQAIDDLVVVLRFEDRLDDLLAPLQRTVRGGARTRRFELRAGRQQVGAVLAVRDRGEGGRMRVGDDQQLERLQPLHHFGHARDGVAAMAHDDDALDDVALIDIVRLGQRRVEPAGPRNARQFHVLLLRARRPAGLRRHFVEARLQIVVADIPDAAPVPPGAFDQAVVERQRGDIEADVGRALHVAVAAEDVGAAAEHADVAGREQQVAISADVGGADRVLGAAHAPDEGRRPLLGEGLGDLLQLLAGNAGDALDFIGRPLRHLGADLVHAVDALGDVLLVLPAIGEDVVQHAPDHRDVGAAAEAHILGRMRGRAREARVEHEHVGAVDLLAGQDVLQRHRVRLGRVRAHEDDGLRIADVVVGVRHRAVAPGVRDTCDGGGVTDAGLVVDRVGAPERRELAEQIAAFVGEFRRAEQIDRVGAGLGADLEHLVADLADRLVPGDLLPLAVDELHRILQPPVAVHQLAHRGALGAMRAAIDRAVPAGLLADPHAVLHFGDHGAADRAVRADVLPHFRRRADDLRAGLGLAHAAERQQPECNGATGRETGAAQERAAIKNARREACGDALQTRPACGSFPSLHQHERVSISSG